eukprot:TRINITY_DN29989_c0_g1_i1.p1 TRINITY_DN29989_c0_g1~~TRINITY_DN29989_c0_g1_i1.p1  ORF type:complete len:634 (+),score=138.69 TRINITY_DN29989_c0_g1_i1:30-1931(+)
MRSGRCMSPMRPAAAAPGPPPAAAETSLSLFYRLHGSAADTVIVPALLRDYAGREATLHRHLESRYPSGAGYFRDFAEATALISAAAPGQSAPDVAVTVASVFSVPEARDSEGRMRAVAKLRADILGTVERPAPPASASHGDQGSAASLSRRASQATAEVAAPAASAGGPSPEPAAAWSRQDSASRPGSEHTARQGGASGRGASPATQSSATHKSAASSCGRDRPAAAQPPPEPDVGPPEVQSVQAPAKPPQPAPAPVHPPAQPPAPSVPEPPVVVQPAVESVQPPAPPQQPSVQRPAPVPAPAPPASAPAPAAAHPPAPAPTVRRPPPPMQVVHYPPPSSSSRPHVSTPLLCAPAAVPSPDSRRRRRCRTPPRPGAAPDARTTSPMRPASLSLPRSLQGLRSHGHPRSSPCRTVVRRCLTPRLSVAPLSSQRDVGAGYHERITAALRAEGIDSAAPSVAAYNTYVAPLPTAPAPLPPPMAAHTAASPLPPSMAVHATAPPLPLSMGGHAAASALAPSMLIAPPPRPAPPRQIGPVINIEELLRILDPDTAAPGAAALDDGSSLPPHPSSSKQSSWGPQPSNTGMVPMYESSLTRAPPPTENPCPAEDEEKLEAVARLLFEASASFARLAPNE